MNLKAVWRELEDDEARRSGYVLRRIAPEADQDLSIGVVRPGGTRVLLLRVHSSQAPNLVDLPRSLGMSVSATALAGDPPGVWAIEVKLGSRDFADVFDSFITDIIQRVGSLASEAGAVAAFLERIRRWQQFLLRVAPDGLSREAQIGLYGELWVLRYEVLPVLGLRSALAAWTGPLGGNQDFQFRGVAAEVKTTTAKAPQMLHIASELQLDSTGSMQLFLVHLSVDTRTGSGESLCDAVATLRKLAAEQEVVTVFDDALLTAGYLEEHSHCYLEPGYSVRERGLFEVREGFPRIVESDLRPGVGDVHYSIAIGSCEPNRTDLNALRRALEERLGG